MAEARPTDQSSNMQVQRVPLAVTAAEVRSLATQPQAPSEYSKQEQELLALLEASPDSPDPEDPLALSPIYDLVVLYIDLGRLVDAERVGLLALSRARKALGPRALSTILCIRTLATVYSKQGRLDEAEKGCRLALDGFERLGEEASPWPVLATMQTLLDVYKNREEWERAKELCEQALKKAEQHYGPESSIWACLSIDLTTIYKRLGDPRTEDHYLLTIEHATNGLGKLALQTIALHYNLGNFYSEKNQLDAAEKCYGQALEGYRAVLGDCHIFTGDVLYSYGNVCYKQDRLQEAEALYVDALRALEAALGGGDAKTLSARMMLGYTFHEQKKWAKAHAAYTEVVRNWTGELEANGHHLKDLESRLEAVNAHLSSL